MLKKLNRRHKAFVRYYLTVTNFNATQAYFKAFKGVSIESADTLGPALSNELLIKEYMRDLAEELGVDKLININFIVDKLLANIASAESLGKHSAVECSLRLLAQLKGLTKTETTVQTNVFTSKDLEAMKEKIKLGVKPDSTMPQITHYKPTTAREHTDPSPSTDELAKPL